MCECVWLAMVCDVASRPRPWMGYARTRMRVPPQKQQVTSTTVAGCQSRGKARVLLVRRPDNRVVPCRVDNASCAVVRLRHVEMMDAHVVWRKGMFDSAWAWSIHKASAPLPAMPRAAAAQCQLLAVLAQAQRAVSLVRRQHHAAASRFHASSGDHSHPKKGR